MIPYSTLFNLVSTYLFGGAATGSWEELITMMLATAGTIFVFSLPFLVVWKLIKLIVGR